MKARPELIACEDMTVPMEKLDNLVVNHLEKRVVDQARFKYILSALLDRRQERSERRQAYIALLNKRVIETDLRLKRLYDAIESCMPGLDDPGLKDSISEIKTTCDQTRTNADRATAMLSNINHKSIKPQMLNRFPDSARLDADKSGQIPSENTSAYSLSVSK